MGRLLARAANDPQVSQTLPELMALISLYTGAASDTNTFSKTRKAAEAEISRRSSLSKDSLLDDEAYSSAFSIINSTLESNVTHDIRLFDPDPLIAAAYQPPGYHSKRFTFPAFYRAS